MATCRAFTLRSRGQKPCSYEQQFDQCLLTSGKPCIRRDCILNKEVTRLNCLWIVLPVRMHDCRENQHEEGLETEMLQQQKAKARLAHAHHHGGDVTTSCHAQSRSHNYCCKGQCTPDVDGTVVGCNGSGPLLGEQLWNQTEADGVLCGLSRCKPNACRKELPKIMHLQVIREC